MFIIFDSSYSKILLYNREVEVRVGLNPSDKRHKGIGFRNVQPKDTRLTTGRLIVGLS